jgi:hypothetical protein
LNGAKGIIAADIRCIGKDNALAGVWVASLRVSWFLDGKEKEDIKLE